MQKVMQIVKADGLLGGFRGYPHDVSCKILRLCIILLFFISKLLFGFITYEFKANKFSKPPVIDGYLNEECWKQAARIDKDFRHWWYDSPEYGMIAPIKTIVLVGYDCENLYFGFICIEPEMSKLRVNTKTVSGTYNDLVGIYLMTFVNRTENYAFYINPYGLKQGFFNIEGSPCEIIHCDFANIEWYAGAKILDTAWTVEVQIPFQSLRFPSTYIDYWRIDFSRHSPARDIVTYYHLRPLERGKSIYTYYARMYINDTIRGPKKIEFLPYGVSGFLIDTLSKDLSLRSGLGAKYFFNYDNILDFSLLPDFSQIETDEPQIDINTTSALYYPEQRPFFLERKGFFETPLEVFYTRTINDPFGAVKYTGDIKGHSFGYICAFDRHTPFIIPFAEQSFSLSSNKSGISNIFRYKKTLLRNTYLGFLITDREIIGGGFNRVLGVDGSFGFLGKNSLRYQGLVSWTKEPFDTLFFSGYGISFNGHNARFDGEEFFGEAFFLEAGRRDKHLSLNVYCKGLSPAFRADNGYISYNDYTKIGFSAAFPYGIKKYIIEYITPELRYERTYRFFNDNTAVNRTGSINFQFKYLINTWFSYQLLDKFYKNMWFKNMWSYNGSLSISTIKNYNLSFFINYGRAINYYSVPLSLGYSLYQSLSADGQVGALSIGLKYTRYLFWAHKFGEWIFDQKTFESSLSYTFSRFMSMRIIGQYNSGTKNLLISPLFSFTPTSLTLFYFGANHNFNNETPFDFDSYSHTRSQIFLKVQYLFKH